MTLRWTIRSLAIALLCLCITGWLLSYPFFRGHRIRTSGHSEIWGCFAYGEIHLGWFASHNASNSLASSPNTWLGFGFRMENDNTVPLTYWWGTIPFWFPTTLSAGLLWFVWRMTRAKLIGRGFPVETTPPI